MQSAGEGIQICVCNAVDRTMPSAILFRFIKYITINEVLKPAGYKTAVRNAFERKKGFTKDKRGHTSIVVVEWTVSTNYKSAHCNQSNQF